MVTYVSAESKWHPAPEVHGLVAGPVFTINSTGLAAALLVTQHSLSTVCEFTYRELWVKQHRV